MISDKVKTLRANFASGLTRPLAFRQQQLAGLARFLKECEKDMEQALFDDLGKSPIEAFATEINPIITELRYTQKHLASWMKAQRVHTPFLTKPAKGLIYPEPLGLTLIIAPWNYPLQLTLSPLIGAIAAGNCVIIKPGEAASACSQLLAERLPDYLDPAIIQVVTGGIPETTALLAEPMDYIFYTGNARVGRIVMEAAAKNLTPVSLELGGKSPCIVDENAEIKVAANRIVWGKFINAGQTCVAPDYVLAHKEIAETLLLAMQESIQEFWGKNPKESRDYARIINANHYQRLVGLLSNSGDIVMGAEHDEDSCYIAPTLVRNPVLDSPMMTDEIFGPLLPIIIVENIEEAIAFVNARPKPLSLYLFTEKEAIQQQVIAQTSSGSVCINHVLLQLAVPELPFGGVGQSGMGAYHGKASFAIFSHYKSVLKKPTWFDPKLLYPPYSKTFKCLLRWF